MNNTRDWRTGCNPDLVPLVQTSRIKQLTETFSGKGCGHRPEEGGGVFWGGRRCVCIKSEAGGGREETELLYLKHLQGIDHAVVRAAELRAAQRRTHGGGTERSGLYIWADED